MVKEMREAICRAKLRVVNTGSVALLKVGRESRSLEALRSRLSGLGVVFNLTTPGVTGRPRMHENKKVNRLRRKIGGGSGRFGDSMTIGQCSDPANRSSRGLSVGIQRMSSSYNASCNATGMTPCGPVFFGYRGPQRK